LQQQTPYKASAESPKGDDRNISNGKYLRGER